MSAARRGTARLRGAGALAVAIDRGDWERAALLLLAGVSAAARRVPAGTVDDVLALLSEEEPRERTRHG